MDFTFTFWQHRRDLWAFPTHPLSSCHVISSLQAAGQSRGFVQVPATHGRAQRSSRSIQTEADFPPKTGPVRAEAGVAVCGQQSLASLLPPELDNTSNGCPRGGCEHVEKVWHLWKSVSVSSSGAQWEAFPP
ncbi:hypothetical protein AOLI_G00038660 [Acnodon oligacanthus]